MDIPPELLQAAKSGDQAARFEINLRRGLEAATGRVVAAPGIQSLTIRQYPPPVITGPNSFRLIPDVVRYMDLVDENLRQTFRDLVSGKAPWPLFLFGLVGPGKTCAALALADYIDRENKHWPAYYTMETLCNEAMDHDRWAEKTAVFRNSPLVIVDEIGEREKVADLYSTTLKQVLDARDQRKNRVGIYISNLSPDDLSRLFDDRLISRLTCGTIFELTGPDRRKARR